MTQPASSDSSESGRGLRRFAIDSAAEPEPMRWWQVAGGRWQVAGAYALAVVIVAEIALIVTVH